MEAQTIRDSRKRLSTDDFDSLAIIGRGAFGEVIFFQAEILCFFCFFVFLALFFCFLKSVAIFLPFIFSQLCNLYPTARDCTVRRRARAGDRKAPGAK